jgi:hypothetical protein
MVNRRPKLELIAPSASPDEAAAIVAALERFMRDTAPKLAPKAPDLDPWRRAAMLEGVERGPECIEGDVSTPWINT